MGWPVSLLLHPIMNEQFIIFFYNHGTISKTDFYDTHIQEKGTTYPSLLSASITIKLRCTPQTRPALATTLPRLAVVPVAVEVIAVVVREMQVAVFVIERSDQECPRVSPDAVINLDGTALGQSVGPHVIHILVYTPGLDGVVREAVLNDLEVKGENDDGFWVAGALGSVRKDAKLASVSYQFVCGCDVLGY